MSLSSKPFKARRYCVAVNGKNEIESAHYFFLPLAFSPQEVEKIKQLDKGESFQVMRGATQVSVNRTI